jgi:hypothetical protein
MANTQITSGLYVCGLCRTEYTRADYLIRHVRSHTRQRPFVCSVCAKGFGRQDLLKRHMAIHNANNENQGGRTAAGSQNGRHGHRVHQACRPCAEKKLKCADEKPCCRCKEKNIVCEFDYGGQRLAPDVSTGLCPSQPLIPFSDTIVESQEEEGNCVDFEEDNSASQDDIQHPLLADMPPTVAQAADDFSVHRQEPIARDILGDTLNFPPMGTYTDNDLFLGDLDFSFLNGLGPSEMPSPQHMAHVLEPTLQQSTMSVGAEAYKHSTALTAWNPGVEENYDQEQQDLILAQSNVGSSSYDVDSSHGRASPKKTLFQTARDRILAMTLRLSSGTASNHIVASFPSLEILSDLIHHALIHLRERQILNFIHFPSFDMNKQRPELLGALIAYGSVTSASPAVRKFGYALQETIRVAINHLVSRLFTVNHQSPSAHLFT